MREHVKRTDPGSERVRTSRMRVLKFVSIVIAISFVLSYLIKLIFY